jgi:hypothetical protein
MSTIMIASSATSNFRCQQVAVELQIVGGIARVLGQLI